MADSRYYIGIDAGGTKSLFTVKNRQSGEKTCFAGGPLNINSIPVEEARKTAKLLFEKAYHITGNACDGIGVGAAGSSNPEAAEFFKEMSEKYFSGVPIVVDTDARAALYGAFKGRDGVIVIAGTGSVCYGEWMGSSAMSGGGGHLLDDGGSAYTIGRDILSAVLRSWDGREKSTILTELLEKETGINSREKLIQFAYSSQTGKKEIASLALLVMEACRYCDPAAQRIVAGAAEELTEMVKAVVLGLGCKNDVRIAFSGSLLLNNGYLRDDLRKRLKETFAPVLFTEAEEDASCGAIYMLERELDGKSDGEDPGKPVRA